MNYIIWKEINSNTIPGLLIQELPSISKPPIRRLIEEIDGRDGDIVEELGYGSYDKVLSIGLTRNFDINEVIKYFSGKGTLVFSNETDKYYEASILEKIDYERLIRYRVAIVTFHVEPFKYKLNEAEIDISTGNVSSVQVTNAGLENSKPKITLFGSGTVTFILNGTGVFTINIDDSYVIVDSKDENAYKGSVLKNRNMSGDFPLLIPGENVITWTGTLTRIKIEPRSRWL